MFRAVMAKEFRHHLLSARFAISAVLFLMVSVTGLFVVGGRYRRDLAMYATEQSKWRDQMAASGSLRDLGMLGVTIARRPQPVSILGRGLEEKMPRSVQVAVYGEPTGTANRYVNPVFFLFESPDLLNMIKTVGTLLALFFVFDAICGEKEAGTLRLIMAHPIRRHTLLLGKCAGAYLALLVPFLVSLLAAAVVMQLYPDLRPGAEGWVRIVLFGGVVSLLLASFFALGLYISTRNERASTALVVSVLIWVVLVLAWPNLVPVMTRPFVRIPSGAEIAEEKRAVHRELRREQRHRERAAADEKERQRIRDEYEQRINDALARVEQRRRRRIETHVTISRSLSRLSPAACFTYAATEILGTGVDDYGDFVDAVERYAVSLREYYREKSEELERSPPPGGGRWSAKFDIRDIPQFEFEPVPVATAVSRALFDLLVLAMTFVVFFLGAWIAFLRYDVR